MRPRHHLNILVYTYIAPGEKYTCISIKAFVIRVFINHNRDGPNKSFPITNVASSETQPIFSEW